jgi:hypothetical protein
MSLAEGYIEKRLLELIFPPLRQEVFVLPEMEDQANLQWPSLIFQGNRVTKENGTGANQELRRDQKLVGEFRRAPAVCACGTGAEGDCRFGGECHDSVLVGAAEWDPKLGIWMSSSETSNYVSQAPTPYARGFGRGSGVRLEPH